MELTSDQQAAITEVLTEVLKTVRPEEIILVSSVFKPEVNVAGKGDALGFGESLSIALLVYPILDALKHVVTTASDSFSKKIGERLAEFLTRPRSQQATLEALSSVRTAVIERMLADGVTAELANQCGDALLATLVTNPNLLARMIDKGGRQ